MTRWNTSLFFIFIVCSQLCAQKPHPISGTVLDSIRGEPMEGVAVYCVECGTGTYTNHQGVFQLTPNFKNTLTLRISYVGYESKALNISTKNNTKKLSILISPTRKKLSEVIIQANSLREKFNSTNSSLESLDAREIQDLPALFGEVDIIKTLQLKPGIASGSEGSSSLIVRGGSGDQNLVLFDGVNIYNPSHLFGFFSTFNNDALSTVDIYKGGFPAQFGGRLSSVIDVKTKKPDTDKISGSGGIGIISSRLTLEGPVYKDKISFMVSGRRTYVDLFTEVINQKNHDKPDFSPIPNYRFFDLNGKLTAKLNKKNDFTFSSYIGADIFKFTSDLFEVDFDWGNKAGSLQWNHAYSDQLYFNGALFHTEYNYTILNSAGDFNFNIGSEIDDHGVRWNLHYNPTDKHYIQAGVQWIHHDFKVGRFKAGSTTDNVQFSAGSTPRGHEYAVFISNEFSPTQLFAVNLGLRYSGFSGSNNTYHNLEPRISLNTSFSDKFNFKTSYARMNQYIHLVRSTGISMPTDIWYPTTDRVKPQLSDQFVLGWNYLLGSSLLITNEYYYKSLCHQIELKDHAQVFTNNNLESEFTFGDGSAYGAEIGLEKKSGSWKGWMGYTLAWVQRGNFKDIEGGDWFSPQFDRRHDLSIVSSYEFNKKWTVSTTFVYGSGDKVWLPAGRLYLQDFGKYHSFPLVPVYEKRNTTTQPSYHRMDLSIVRTWEAQWGHHNLTFSIYNLYNRRNPYFHYLDSEKDDLIDGLDDLKVPIKITPKQVSLFPILPSISWNFKF